MKEKERFTDLHYLDSQIFVYDNTLKSKRVIGIEECFELLNQQDKRIKELESKLRVSNSLNTSLSLEYSDLKKQYDNQENLLSQKLAENSRLTLENQQIKEKLNNFETCMKKI